MTREEAVSIIEDRVRVTEYVKSSYVDCVDVEALKMAIEALKGKDTNVPSRKGVFIPDITVEMFRNASLEGVEDFMTSGEMEDISLPSAQPEQSIAQERYEDLCEYFKDCSDQGRSILTDRKEFKSWLDRAKWHVMECDKLGRELEKLKSAQTEPCGDTISRQAAISLPVKPKEDRYFQTQNLDDAYDYGWRDLQRCIEKLPPAQQGRETGAWIAVDYFVDGKPAYREWECSKCRCVVEDEKPTWNFCPMCGTDMRSE